MGILARDQSSVRHSARARDPPLPRPLLIHFFSCFLFPEVWFASCALMVRKILPHRLHSLCRRERLTWLDNWRKERMDRHEPAHIYLFLWTLRSKAVRIVFKISPLDIRNKLQRQFSFWELSFFTRMTTSILHAFPKTTFHVSKEFSIETPLECSGGHWDAERSCLFCFLVFFFTTLSSRSG